MAIEDNERLSLEEFATLIRKDGSPGQPRPKTWKVLLTSLLFVAGLSAILIGTAMIYPPAALIVAGIIFLVSVYFIDTEA